MRCRECNKAFSTPSRAVRYCSDECRRAVRKRQSNAPRKRRPAEDRGPSKCRTCGKEFTLDKRGPGKPVAYCSEKCRTEGKRRLYREAMRRYSAKPENRALMAARVRASAARRKAREEEERKRAARGA